MSSGKQAKPRAYLVAGLIAAMASTSSAQISAPTDEDKETAPIMFRSQVTGKPTPKYQAVTAPSGVYPKTGPRDFSGTYSVLMGPVSARPAAPANAGPPPAEPGQGAPGQICVPSFDAGVAAGGYPGHIVFSPGRVTIVMEADHRIRRIYLDSSHPKNLKPTYGGDSIGHWEGDTLVVDTIGIRGKESTHLIERIRKLEGGRTLEIVTTTQDTQTGAKSTQTTTANWRPDLQWIEDICEDFGEAFGEGYLKKE